VTDTPVVGTLEHYEDMIDEGVGVCWDDPVMQGYMSRWDGPLFFETLGDMSRKDVLEIGVGTGRIARQVLGRGCRHLTGIDFSPKTIGEAKENLADYPNVELVCGDIADFVRRSAFDIAYSVLTFMHIEDKPTALKSVAGSLKTGGRIVLSVAEEGEWLDYGSRKVRLHYAPPHEYGGWLTGLGLELFEPVDLIDRWVSPKGKKQETYGKKIATLIQARKVVE